MLLYYATCLVHGSAYVVAVAVVSYEGNVQYTVYFRVYVSVYSQYIA
jgi:hypothetical protein